MAALTNTPNNISTLDNDVLDKDLSVKEAKRLEALAQYDILDTPKEAAFDRIAALAATIFETPMAQINFLDSTRQWSKSHVGVDVCEVSREVAFCTHALPQQDVLVVPDATRDDRFADNPLVTGEPFIQFYAGAPLVVPSGEVLGTLCVLDRTPRAPLSAKEEQVLANLAALVMDELELRRERARAQAAEAKLREEKRLVESILSSLPGIFYIFDIEGRIVRWNHALETMSGYSAAELSQMGPMSFFEPKERPRAAAEMAKLLKEGETNATLNFRCKDGSTVPHLFTGQRLETASGTYLLGTAIDITEQLQIEQALRENEEKFRQFAEHIDDVFWMTDASRKQTIYVNPAFEALWGSSPEALYQDSQKFSEAIHPDDRPRVVAAQSKPASDYDVEYRLLRPDGTLRWIHDRAFPVTNEAGEVTRVVGIAENITRRKQSEETLQALNERLNERTRELEKVNTRLSHTAFHDALTGLPNRVLFTQRLTQAVKRQRLEQGGGFAVLFLDFDRFKVINDSLGHATGDALLVEAARRLRASVRAADTVARLGGDEFTVLLKNTANVAEATRVVEKIQTALAEPYLLDGHELTLSASIGVVMSEPGHTAAGDVLRDADIAMYRAKALGKATFQVFDTPMREQAASLLTLESDLRKALKQREFEVHYQPIFELDNRQVTGFEALVRRRHPERGLISPGEFIPVAEDTGLIVELDRWVLATACEQVRRWQEDTGQPLSLSVNLSSKAFDRADLVTSVENTLEISGFPAEQLHLEITESILVSDTPHIYERLAGLRALGVALHIDDFGTGYSSLSYLERFSANTLKIDRAFINKMLQSAESGALVKTIITLAHAFGMTVVAEGVETEAQLGHLRTLACDYIQGYLLGKPLPPEVAADFLEDTRSRATEQTTGNAVAAG